MGTNYKIIDTVAGLEKAVRTLEKGKAVAVDMEADSMYHFKEKVCLIQMATKKSSILIDPLHVKDLSSLKPLFSDPDIKKIFHGADYDVRSLFRDFTIEINNLFDTELACRFLGNEGTGLEAVLKKYLDISLNKKYQKKDWSQRPLPPPPRRMETTTLCLEPRCSSPGETTILCPISSMPSWFG